MTKKVMAGIIGTVMLIAGVFMPIYANSVREEQTEVYEKSFVESYVERRDEVDYSAIADQHGDLVAAAVGVCRDVIRNDNGTPTDWYLRYSLGSGDMKVVHEYIDANGNTCETSIWCGHYN